MKRRWFRVTSGVVLMLGALAANGYLAATPDGPGGLVVVLLLALVYAVGLSLLWRRPGSDSPVPPEDEQ